MIGGGATGAGCALDAATRGLKTAMVSHLEFLTTHYCTVKCVTIEHVTQASIVLNVFLKKNIY